MKELNERMARRAGFKYIEGRIHLEDGWADGYWRLVDFTFRELPDFPSDETACFKYLVPTLGSGERTPQIWFERVGFDS